MANEMLIHDVAFATSRQIVEALVGWERLREEVRRDVFVEIFERVKAGVERFELENYRMAHRLRPGRD